jgi:hypothetical protein
MSLVTVSVLTMPVMSWLKAVDDVLWHVDLLLGSDCEIGNCTAAVASQQAANNSREWCFLCGPCQDVISRTVGAVS